MSINLSITKKTFWLPILLLLFGCGEKLHSQKSYEKEKKRLEYLSLGKGLSDLVQLDEEGVKIFPNSNIKNSTPEFTLYWEEKDCFVKLIKSLSMDSLEKIYLTKVNKRFKLDGCLDTFYYKSSGSLSGKKIAIDPGHFAGEMATAKIEQKYLDFKAKDKNGDSIAIKISEGVLTWHTAFLLKAALEKEGAVVMMTRPELKNTSFGISFEDWCKNFRNKTLDSLKKHQKISPLECKKWLGCNTKKFFWEFFRDFELYNRSKKINDFKPDLTVIIHYNVDEKNTDWKKPTEKNFTMCFIGGAMNKESFDKVSNKVNFLRLLLSDDLERSDKIAGLTVNEFSKNLDIKIDGKNDADYLREKCVESKSSGVFCRNLALCRTIASPLVYGECLYQDNKTECLELIKNDKMFDGIKSNSRVKKVAESYFNAIKKYFEDSNN